MKKKLQEKKSVRSSFLSNTCGFTLIEMIVVIGVISLLLPVVFGLFYLDITSQKKTALLQETKRSGDNALSVFESHIHNDAVKIVSADYSTTLCDAVGATEDLGSSVTFKDREGSYFTFTLDATDPDSIKIASESSVAPTAYLTSSAVSVTAMTFSCTRTASFASPYISVQFTISQAGSVTRPEDSDQLPYSTIIKLRNYEEEL